MKIIMTTIFGVESVTADEVAGLGYDRQRIDVSDGQVALSVDGPVPVVAEAVARLNVNLATAERVLLQLASFPALTFDELFESARKLPWEAWLPDGFAFHINGYSRKSRLFGVSACQSLIKKAIVDRLLAARHMPPGSLLPEDRQAGLIRIQFAIVSDQVSLMVDTSGDGLHKRGYRPLSHEAPIKETLAAAILRLARFRTDGSEALLDPMCGSGTFPIEAALIASRTAPGMHRTFAGEYWPLLSARPFELARQEARERQLTGAPDRVFIFGSDLSAQAVETARANARRAGMAHWLTLEQADALAIRPGQLAGKTGCQRHLVVCNPPYGERLLDAQAASQLASGLSRVFLDHGKAREGIRFHVITADEQFEKLAGGPADKRRKLYNGMIKCTLYQYFKQRSKHT